MSPYNLHIIAPFSPGTKPLTHFLALIGYLAREVVLGIISFFFMKAGILNNAGWVVNTDKAFDFIGVHVGHASFILVAIAIICYGLFMFVPGLTYETNKKG